MENAYMIYLRNCYLEDAEIRKNKGRNGEWFGTAMNRLRAKASAGGGATMDHLRAKAVEGRQLCRSNPTLCVTSVGVLLACAFHVDNSRFMNKAYQEEHDFREEQREQWKRQK
ncbi:hypothetical protein MKW92_014584 [Papaver armeniacum]|nr:hypothetical protein MKW92_014584 [Papaver armeniacum]